LVEAYISVPLRGLLKILPMVSEPWKSLIGVQTGFKVPPLVVFQMPPPSVPAHMVREVVVPVLSISKSFTRPTGCASPVKLVQPPMPAGKPADLPSETCAVLPAFASIAFSPLG
jgi:hypothetical protein